jgi:hypothetical protein
MVLLAHSSAAGASDSASGAPKPRLGLLSNRPDLGSCAVAGTGADALLLLPLLLLLLLLGKMPAASSSA